MLKTEVSQNNMKAVNEEYGLNGFPEMDTLPDDWALSGGGMEGESYVSKSHPELIMKVYTTCQSESAAEHEYHQVSELQQGGISVPKALKVIRFNGHPALISQRILNKKSFCRLAGEKPEMIPELAKRMAAMVRELHGQKLQGGSTFPGALDKYRQLLECNTVLDERGKTTVASAIDAIASSETPTILHGDMHFGNVITDGNSDFFIDLGDVSWGNPNHDLAMFYITTHYGCDHSFNFLYHVTWPQALGFWEVFKTSYYGREISDEEVFNELRNYMLARCVWFKHDQIQTELCSILQRKDSLLTAEIRLAALGE